MLKDHHFIDCVQRGAYNPETTCSSLVTRRTLPHKHCSLAASLTTGTLAAGTRSSRASPPQHRQWKLRRRRSRPRRPQNNIDVPPRIMAALGGLLALSVLCVRAPNITYPNRKTHSKTPDATRQSAAAIAHATRIRRLRPRPCPSSLCSARGLAAGTFLRSGGT